MKPDTENAPDIVYPPDKITDLPDMEVCRKNDDLPLKIRCVPGLDWWAFGFNVSSLALFAGLTSLFIVFLTDSLAARIGWPLAIAWVTAVAARDRFWVKVESRMARVYLDMLFPEKLVVYPQGFHFTSWSSRRQPDELDFQKHEEISARRSNKDPNEIVFPCKDGYELVAEVATYINWRPDEESISYALKYKWPQLQSMVLAIIRARLSDIGGHNSLASMLKHKRKVAAWVARIFGGNENISLFEWKTGISVMDPILEDLDLTSESKEIFQTGAKTEVITNAIKALRELKVSPDEASITAQTVEGSTKRVVYTYQGIPSGASVVALGDAGMAIATDGGRGKQKQKQD